MAASSGRALIRHSRVLGRRGRVDDDTAADAQPDPVARPLERADGHVELEPGHWADVADGAGVGLAVGGLGGGDDLHGRDLGRAGHRAGREAGAHEIAVVAVDRERARRRRTRGARRRGGPRPGRSRARRSMPGRHTRPRSLRTRSTIITFSAWSLADRSSWSSSSDASSGSSGRSRVPLIGDERTSRPVRARNSSGENDATSRPGRREVRGVAPARAPRRLRANRSRSTPSIVGFEPDARGWPGRCPRPGSTPAPRGTAVEVVSPIRIGGEGPAPEGARRRGPAGRRGGPARRGGARARSTARRSRAPRTTSGPSASTRWSRWS